MSNSPPGFSPAPARRRRRVLVLAIGATAAALLAAGVIVAVVLVSGAVEPVAAPSPRPTAREYDDSVDEVVVLGQPGENRAGIGFTVTSVDCDGVTKVTQGTSVQKAWGEFCTVGVDIANNGTTPYLFWETHAVAGVGDYLYAVDTVSTLWNGESTAYTEPIEPGTHISTELVFDVPYGEQIDYFQFGQAVVAGLVIVDTSAEYTTPS